MVVREVYPQLSKQNRTLLKIRNVVGYVFLTASLVCLVVNYMIKGKPWSVVVVWSICSVWDIVFSPDRFEFNVINQTVKVVFHVIVLLWLIDICLVRTGWYKFVVPIVCFGALILTAIMLFIDINAQIHNSMPMIWLIIFSVGFVVFMIINSEIEWPVIVLGSVAVALLCLSILYHKEFLLELKKRFHTN